MDRQNNINSIFLIMIRKAIIIVSLLYFNLTIGQISPQSKKITEKFFPEFETLENVTPALQKKKGYTNYEELISFLNELATAHPTKVKISFIGQSQKGREIPMIKITNPNDKDKIKVWMQGGLHGNEFASTEGMLYTLHQLLNDKNYNLLLDDIVLVIVPMTNIDGYLKGNRYAANGLDLNRDQTKLMATESVSLKSAFSKFNPEVGVDFHEYRPYRKDFAQLGDFGITSVYDVMFLYSGNLNVPLNLRSLTDTIFVENARNILDENQLRHHDYISTGTFGGELHFNQGSVHSRSSATNYALTNTISALIEVRGVGIGRTSFKRRINTTFLVALSFLETAAKNKDLIKTAIEIANHTKNDIVVLSSKSIYKDTIKTIDLNSNEIIDLEVTMRDALKSTPDLTRKKPTYYLIDADEVEIIEKLKTLGAEMELLDTERELEVETYLISDYKKNMKKYEKMNRQTVKTTIVVKKIIFSKNTIKISMDQRRSNIISEVLEPEGVNSFVGFGVLKTDLGETLPIYRITN